MTGRRVGYTLIEALLLLLIVAFIIFIGASSLTHHIPKYRLHSAVWEVSAKLNEARYTAVLKGAPVRMHISNSDYCLEQQNIQDGSWHRLSGRRLEGVALRANNTPTFYPQGTVSNLATIWVENRWGRYKITLAITGRIKVAKA
jgi:Tfp pilus assembly protein FimT